MERIETRKTAKDKKGRNSGIAEIPVDSPEVHKASGDVQLTLHCDIQQPALIQLVFVRVKQGWVFWSPEKGHEIDRRIAHE